MRSLVGKGQGRGDSMHEKLSRLTDFNYEKTMLHKYGNRNGLWTKSLVTPNAKAKKDKEENQRVEL